MATVSERAGIVGPSEAREIGWDTGRDRGHTAARGMEIPRVFSNEGTSPYDEVEWEIRTAEIKDERGGIIFEQTDCEVPRGWSQLATNVVVSKYFYGDVASGNGSPATGNREYSVRQLIDRVTRTIADWGKEDGYFATAADANRFYDELTALCLNQYGSFNSPVWFNVGLYDRYEISGPANNWRWDEETRSVARATSAYQYPAGVCLLHSERQRRYGRDHAAGDERGDALQVRIRNRHRSVELALEPREALGWRQAIRSGQFHAGIRRGCERRQVGG